MAGQIILPRQLPPAAEVFSDAQLVVDSGTTVQRATPQQVVDAATILAVDVQMPGEGNVNNALNLKVSSFPSRAALVAYVATNPSLPDGTELRAEGMSYLWRSGSTEIEDMPNVVEGVFSETVAPEAAKLPGYMRHQVVLPYQDGLGVDILPALHGAIADLDAIGGGGIIIPYGSFGANPDGVKRLVQNNLRIEMRPGARIVGFEGFTQPIINLKGAESTSGAPGSARLDLYNMTIDASRGNVGTPEAVSPSAISPAAFASLLVDTPNLYGGPFYSDAGIVGGDSGISPVNIGRVVVRDGYIRGFRDAGVYGGGGNSLTAVDDGVSTLIQGTFFEHCSQGVVIKRDGRHHLVLGVTAIDCGYGVDTADVGAGQEQLTGELVEVRDCFIDRPRSAGIMFRGQTKGVASNNRIRDWGFEERGLGTAPNGVDRSAILIEGAFDADVSNNRMEFSDLTPVDQIGIRVRSYTTADGVFWAGGRVRAVGNSFFDVPRWYDESNGTVQPSLLTENYARNGDIGRMVAGTLFERRIALGQSARIYRNSVAGLAVPAYYADRDLENWAELTATTSLPLGVQGRGFAVTGTNSPNMTLPTSAPEGWFVNIASRKTGGTLSITPPAGETITLVGTTKAAGAAITTNTLGASVRMQKVAGQWSAMFQAGTWT